MSSSVNDATIAPLNNGNPEEENPILSSNATQERNQLRVYPLRWLILILFVLYSTSNAFQWTQLVIITNILEKYYNVSTLSVSWTSMIYMVTYIPLIFPASWFLEKKVRCFILLESILILINSNYITVSQYFQFN